MESPTGLTDRGRPKKHYDSIAPCYDSQRFGCRCGSIINDVELSIVRELVAQNGNVLDVGTGTGRFATILASASTTTVALDSSRQMISISVAKGEQSERSRQVSYLVGDGASLPFSSRSFDAVISVKLLSHFSEIDPFISEMSRVLKTGGRLITDVPYPLAELYQRFVRNPSIQSSEDHFHTIPEIERVFKKHSIEISRRVMYSALPLSVVHLTLCPHTTLFPTRLLHRLLRAKVGFLTFLEGIKGS